MKEIIIVYGNMGSGKSTFSRSLKKHLPSYQYVCLDDYRKDNFGEVLEDGHNTHEFEHKVARKTKAAIKDHQQVIYETTGGTRFFKEIYADFIRNQYKLYIVHIHCPPAICLERHMKREQDGHFHVVPVYKKRLDPKEYIERLEDRSAWIKADLVLNSEKYKPHELIKQFFQKFNAKGSNPELRQIIKDFDYSTGLKWFNDHVEGKFFVKEMLSSGEDDFNRARLKKELHQVLDQLESSAPTSLHKPVPERSRRKPTGRDTTPPQATITPAVTVKVTERAAQSPEELELKEKWLPLYSKASMVFGQLDLIEDDGKRKQACFEVLDLMDRVSEVWQEADFVKVHGKKPEYIDQGMDDMTPEQMSKRIRTLRTYISKAKKGKLKKENIPTWEAEKAELERRVSA
ncbi:hypothetical protein DN752_17835 [Echinicola strongylocentroti]|uniref:Uncharacterized protein n=1 Tax=Echinicola strongylocentroti TaxID=1795355 RepID=A0A2Z4IL56_9BACT|nr:AAA family ATPase [Echinicola strongylocentroti]AWW31842.1 hypothetical protein DN752_17835 [Echinicola strongylocentroti]